MSVFTHDASYSIVRARGRTLHCQQIRPLCLYTCIDSSCPFSWRISRLPGSVKGLKGVFSSLSNQPEETKLCFETILCHLEICWCSEKPRSRVCRGRKREIWALSVKSRYREIVSEDGLRFCGYQNPLVSTLNGSYFLPRTLHRFLKTISAIAFSFSNFCNGYISEELKKMWREGLVDL